MEIVSEIRNGDNGHAAGPFDTRISHLKVLALSLLREIASAENTRENGGDRTIDLQAEVRRFETELIRSALIQTGGCQRQAARLLRTKVTTLNTKIRKYKIDIFRISK
jgi:transcriptional regulator with GAF, ATPase, and Fis domain